MTGLTGVSLEVGTWHLGIEKRDIYAFSEESETE